jgi:TolB-like protein
MNIKKLIWKLTVIALAFVSFKITIFAQEQEQQQHTMAVLYFDNGSIKDSEKLDPLKKGMAAMIITELSKLNKFKVVERERIQNILDEFDLNQKPIIDEATKQKMGRFLGAKLLLVGSFMNMGKSFRVDARIIQTETGLTVSTCEVTKTLDDLFDVVKDVTKKIVEDLKVELLASERKYLDRNIAVKGDDIIKFSDGLNLQDKARHEERFGNIDNAKYLYQQAKSRFEEAYKANSSYIEAKDKVSEIEKVLADMEQGVDRTPPQIVLAGSSDGGRGLTTSHPIHKIVGFAADESGIVDITINGVKATIQESNEEEASAYSLKGKVVKFAADIPLAIGENSVEINAIDLLSNIGRQYFKVKRAGEVIKDEKIEQPTKLEFSLPKIHAVIVGVSEYSNSNFNLNYADADAKIFYDFLKSQSGGAIPDDRIKLLLNKDATRTNIVGWIKKIFENSSKEDLIIFYFAGHGWAEGQTMYFLSNEVEMDNLIGTALSQDDIEKSFKYARAKRALMIADACHAGATKISFGTARDVDIRNRLLLEIAQSSEGLTLLTAAGSNQQSKEDARWGGGHGVFTYHLVNGLKGSADEDNNKIITVREIFDYVDRKVKEDTQGVQRPDRDGPMDLPISVIK